MEADIRQTRQFASIIIEEKNSTPWNLPRPNPSVNQQKRQHAGKSAEQIWCKHHVNKLGPDTSSERLCSTETCYASCLLSSALQALSHRRRSVLANQERSYRFPTNVMDPLWESEIQRTHWRGSGQNRHFNLAPHLNRSRRVQVHISKMFNIFQQGLSHWEPRGGGDEAMRQFRDSTNNGIYLQDIPRQDAFFRSAPKKTAANNRWQKNSFLSLYKVIDLSSLVEVSQ